MTSTDRTAAAGLLRQLRESRGWSWADLARALRDTGRRLAVTSLTHCQVTSIQRTIARWESTLDPTGPSDRYQFLLAQLYAHTPDGSLALGPGSDFDTLLEALQHFGTPPQRRRQLAALVTPSLTAEARHGLSGQGDPQQDCRRVDASVARGAGERDLVVTAPWSHRGTVAASVALSGGGLVERRTFLLLTGAALTTPAHEWLVHEPGPLVSASSGGRVPAVLVDRLPAMIAELRTLDDAAGGGTVLSLAQHNFSWVSRLLDQASYDERTGRTLHVALAELGQLAGWAADDAGQQGLGQRYYVAALHAAHSADHRPLGAHILGSMSVQAARQDRPAEAVSLVETALAGARGHETPSLLASLHNRQALALATLNDAPACATAISKARTQIEQLTPDDTPPWLYWVSPAEITATAGKCLLRLGHADQGAALLEEGIALFDPSFVRDRQAYVTYRADALARPGPQRDLDAAAGQGMVAIDLAESLTSTRSADHIRDLHHQMKPHAQVPAVGDFLERARGFLAAY